MYPQEENQMTSIKSKEAEWCENHDIPAECDSCGSTEHEIELLNDCGILVCRPCINTGEIWYVTQEIINSNGIIRFSIDYSQQKEVIRDNNLIFVAFKDFNLGVLAINYGESPFIITVTLVREDAVIFKLKDLKHKILCRIKDYILQP